MAPAEATWVREHLAACPACRGREARLAAVTPRATAQVADATLIALQLRLDAAMDAEWADPARPAAPAVGGPPASAPWWRAETRVPASVSLAYALAFGLVALWGVQQWKAHQHLRVAIATQALEAAPGGALVATEPLPGELVAPEQFQPASWAPEDAP